MAKDLDLMLEIIKIGCYLINLMKDMIHLVPSTIMCTITTTITLVDLLKTEELMIKLYFKCWELAFQLTKALTHSPILSKKRSRNLDP